ncbi:cyclophilin-like protein [Piedraia hortae CBS 480.64]|uniref:Peptidyl-prolyl cis-trans isomerase n=1 Tax=Piedraia hortae CBS 480.64 TaxID=1314780 RepID=A0A6A7C372_9PEZI|nr:cyclophilin-like protein [Piedraia hortae CBS 480.64]
MSLTLHTSHGQIKVDLFCSLCPKTCYNFLALAATGAYESSPFHRIIPGFIVQTGSPASAGIKSSPSIYGFPFEDEIRSSLRHNAKGILSMANKGPGTNGSQFFITLAPAPHLDGKNSVFGRVIDGWETLDELEKTEVDAKGRPANQKVTVDKVEIHANPLADE